MGRDRARVNSEFTSRPLHDFVLGMEALLRNAKALPPSEMARLAGQWVATHPQRPPEPDAPVCVIVSPHPDDECIIGGLPLRLMQESGWRVVSIVVTHGSNPARQLARAEEFVAACSRIGFEPLLLSERGLLRVTPQTRDAEPVHWAHNVQLLATRLAALKPSLVLCPHALDGQSTHMGTHHLTIDALRLLSASISGFSTTLAFTEYWSTMTKANLLVELTAEQVGDMISALACHVGEVSRNPFHLSVPAWLIDNVRRGGELVGASGGDVPDYTFAAIYNVMQWHDGALQISASPAQMIGRDASCAAALNGHL